MRPPNPNPKVVYLKTPPQSQQERYHAAQEHLAATEYRAREIHHYDVTRGELGTMAFAEHILKREGLLYDHYGHSFLDGRYATPAMKIAAANAVLKRMRLAPIVLRRKP